MDFPKLLSLLESAHGAYATTIATAAITLNEWMQNAADGRESEWQYANSRQEAALTVAHDALAKAHPHVSPSLISRNDPHFKAYEAACDVANDEYYERFDAARDRYTETTGYANQWYDAAIKGAAQDFNLALIRAMDEAGKP